MLQAIHPSSVCGVNTQPSLDCMYIFDVYIFLIFLRNTSSPEQLRSTDDDVPW
jgi:hypothetical protein